MPQTINHRALAFITFSLVVLITGIGAAPPADRVPVLVHTLGTQRMIVFRVLPSTRNIVHVDQWSGGTETEAWCAELIERLHVVPQRQGVGACVAWVRAEGTYMTINNPLNTTQEMPNQTGIHNSVGVKIYPDRETGMRATVITFGYPNHGYEAIVDGFVTNDGDRVVRAVEASDWGTGGLAITIWDEIKRNYQ